MAKRKSETTGSKVLWIVVVLAFLGFLGFLGYVLIVPNLPLDLLEYSWYLDIVNHASELKDTLAADSGFYTVIAIFLIAVIAVFVLIKKYLKKA